VSIELFPFRVELDIPNVELFELANGEETKGMFVECNFTKDVMD
jgi:hypothetical protein